MIKVIKSSKQRDGCPIHLIRNGSPNWWWFVMVRNDPSPCWWWSVVLHTSMNVCGVIILEQGILLLSFTCYFCCLRVIKIRHEPTCHPFWWPITDQMYWTCKSQEGLLATIVGIAIQYSLLQYCYWFCTCFVNLWQVCNLLCSCQIIDNSNKTTA